MFAGIFLRCPMPGVSYTAVAKGVVTITLSNPDAGVERGMCISTSGTSGPPTTYWVVGRKSATELIVASSWRDSLWVLWFQFKAWFLGLWWAIRNRYRRDDELEDEEDDRIIVAPVDSEDDVNGSAHRDPRTLN